MRFLILLMLVYLLGAAILAMTVDRRFFVNDALAIVIFVVLGVGLFLIGRTTKVDSGPGSNG